MKTKIVPADVQENKAEDFKNLFVRDLLTSSDTQRISFHYCRMEPNGEILNDKHESIEVYYFLKGSGDAEVDGEKHEVAPGAVICVDSNKNHTVRNTGTVDLEFLAILSPPYV